MHAFRVSAISSASFHAQIVRSLDNSIEMVMFIVMGPCSRFDWYTHTHGRTDAHAQYAIRFNRGGFRAGNARRRVVLGGMSLSINRHGDGKRWNECGPTTAFIPPYCSCHDFSYVLSVIVAVSPTPPHSSQLGQARLPQLPAISIITAARRSWVERINMHIVCVACIYKQCKWLNHSRVEACT